MKNKKTLKVLLLFYGISFLSQAQNLPVTRDTMQLKLNGESTTVLVPNPGKKTTVIFEDTSSQIQVKVLKLQNSIKSNKDLSIKKKPNAIKWISEIDLGIIKMSENIEFYQQQSIYSGNRKELYLRKEYYMSRMTKGAGFTINIFQRNHYILNSSLSFFYGLRTTYDQIKIGGRIEYYNKENGDQYSGSSVKRIIYNQYFVPLGLSKEYPSKELFIDRFEIGVSCGALIVHQSENMASDFFLYKDPTRTRLYPNLQYFFKIYSGRFYFVLYRGTERYYGYYSGNEPQLISKSGRLDVFSNQAFSKPTYLGIGFRLNKK